MENIDSSTVELGSMLYEIVALIISIVMIFVAIKVKDVLNKSEAVKKYNLNNKETEAIIDTTLNTIEVKAKQAAKAGIDKALSKEKIEEKVEEKPKEK